VSLLALLLLCHSRRTLREAWLVLTDEQRAGLRWDPTLADHAWSVLKRSPA
jgi:predicted RNA polymerase sigma factor